MNKQEAIDKLNDKLPWATIAGALTAAGLTVPMGTMKQMIINTLVGTAIGGTVDAINHIKAARKIEKGDFKESVDSYLNIMEGPLPSKKEEPSIKKGKEVKVLINGKSLIGNIVGTEGKQYLVRFLSYGEEQISKSKLPFRGIESRGKGVYLVHPSFIK